MIEDTENLIGKRVINTKTRIIGVIENVDIDNRKITIDFHGKLVKYQYPDAFSSTLEIEDKNITLSIQKEGLTASFEQFKTDFSRSIQHEIDYLKATGGKKYRLSECTKLSSANGEKLYSFETDTELNLPDGTAVRLRFADKKINGYVVSCEDFTILIRLYDDLDDSLVCVDMTYDQSTLLVALMDRLNEMNPDSDSLAYELACNGRSKISVMDSILCGQEKAVERSKNERITFIWGPPGTGKTETLANIAKEHIQSGKRVLMMSYSNVSVDGATLRVASKINHYEGNVVRYGYPRMQELLDKGDLTTYQCALKSNQSEAKLFDELIEQKKKLKKNDPSRRDINNKINAIKESLLRKEKELIYKASFVATTVSKATVDHDIYSQRFDAVIFDEASMAYVPQIVFAAGLVKSHFICLGDFRQLPSIVQNKSDDRLGTDIFDYTGITEAVENGYSHEWLVMLNNQYRMHYDIADFVSNRMYQGLLTTNESILEDRERVAALSPCSGAAISCIDLSYMYSSCKKTSDGSRVNILSALLSLRNAELNIEEKNIGIIAPYSAQARLLLAMIRDLQEKSDKWNNVVAATVHQFQGSEKSIIIYDTVDCFRMTYPGVLLTEVKNNQANRLFNVAITRSQGKFILISNLDFFRRKNLSSKLLLSEAINSTTRKKDYINGQNVVNELKSSDDDEVFVSTLDSCWEKYIDELENAEKTVNIDVPGSVKKDNKRVYELYRKLKKLSDRGIKVSVRVSDESNISENDLFKKTGFVVFPLTIIDKEIIWYGPSLFDKDFRSEGVIIKTEYFPCVRFKGLITAKMMLALLD